MTQTCNSCAETHLGGGDTSTSVVPLAAIAQVLSLTFVGSTAFRKAHEDSDHTVAILLSFTDTYMPKLTVLAKL